MARPTLKDKRGREKLGFNIQMIREHRNLTQAALAAKIGSGNASTICSWENGDRVPTLEMAARLAKALNVNLDDLMEEVL